MFPNESAAYREARDALTDAEHALRRQAEEVAAQRRRLPLGGRVREDYAFREHANGALRTVRLSDLFGGHDSLFVYGYMFDPERSAPCPMCTAFLDNLDANARHIGQRIGIAAVARSSAERLDTFGKERGWRYLRLVSADGTTFRRDYRIDDADGNMLPMAHVFVRREGAIHHAWASEVFYRPREEGGDPRHVDAFWPLWQVLDLTPEGRGSGWYPSLRYDEA